MPPLRTSAGYEARRMPLLRLTVKGPTVDDTVPERGSAENGKLEAKEMPSGAVNTPGASQKEELLCNLSIP